MRFSHWIETYINIVSTELGPYLAHFYNNSLFAITSDVLIVYKYIYLGNLTYIYGDWT